LYRGEALSLSLREGQWLRVFDNRVLRRIFGIKGVSNRGLEKTAHKALQKLYFSPNTIRIIKSWKIKWVQYEANMGEEGNSSGLGQGLVVDFVKMVMSPGFHEMPGI
jgi:hypothetical protein